MLQVDRNVSSFCLDWCLILWWSSATARVGREIGNGGCTGGLGRKQGVLSLTTAYQMGVEVGDDRLMEHANKAVKGLGGVPPGAIKV